MYQQTSRQAFRFIRDTGRMNMRQQQIYDLLEAYPEGLTDSEISDALHLRINSITPRRGELVDKNMVEAYGRKKNIYGHSAIVWRIKREIQQELELSK